MTVMSLVRYAFELEALDRSLGTEMDLMNSFELCVGKKRGG